MNKILDAARYGKWVLVCPVVFPQYMSKLCEKLQQEQTCVHADFRLILDI